MAALENILQDQLDGEFEASASSTREQILVDGNNFTAAGTIRSRENPCFSTKTALIAIALTISVSALVVVTLDLTIFEIQREARTKWASSGVVPEDEYTFSMSGSEDSDTMKIFDAIPSGFPVFHLNLSNVEVNPAILTKQLEYTFVKTISLINVTMIGRMGMQDDIFLHDIKRYRLELNQPIGPDQLFRLKNKNCSLPWTAGMSMPAETFQDKHCLRSLIFFHNFNLKKNWSIEQVHLLNTTIQITLFGIHYFVIDPIEGEIVSVFNFTQDILEDILNTKEKSPIFNLRKFNLFTSRLDLSVLSQFSESLTELGLFLVDFGPNQNALSPVLKKLTSLTRLLAIMEYHYPLKTEIDLSDITINILDLAFQCVRLDFKAPISTDGVHFSLNHLYFEDVTINNLDIIRRFDQLFDAKRVYWGDDNFLIAGQSGLFSRCELWLNIMKTRSIEYIIFEGNSAWDDRLTEPRLIVLRRSHCNNARLSSTVTNTLRNISVDVDINKSFMMKKDDKGVWTGKNYNEGKFEEAFEIHAESGFFSFPLKFVTKEFYMNLKYD